MFNNILVGYNGTKGGKAALDGAAELAKRFESKLTALLVREPFARYSDLPGEFEGDMEFADEELQRLRLEVFEAALRYGLSITCESSTGSPAKTIVKHADEGRYDLIVLGRGGHSETWRRLVGDTVGRIRKQAHCSVLVVQAGA